MISGYGGCAIGIQRFITALLFHDLDCGAYRPCFGCYRGLFVFIVE